MVMNTHQTFCDKGVSVAAEFQEESIGTLPVFLTSALSTASPKLSARMIDARMKIQIVSHQKQERCNAKCAYTTVYCKIN